jgi:hypothetical protein
MPLTIPEDVGGNPAHREENHRTNSANILDLPEAPDAGTLWYELGQGAVCYASFPITPLVVNDRRLRPAGVIQCLHTEQCTPAHLERVLLHLGQRFLAHACFVMSL